MTKQSGILNLSEFNSLSLDDVKRENVIANIEELSEDSQYVSEPIAAREFFDAIDQLIERYRTQINGTGIYTKLNGIKIKMLWFALPAIPKKIREKIFSENLITAVKQNIDIPNSLANYLSTYEFKVGPDTETRQKLIYSLTKNEEVLGTQSLQLKSGGMVTSSVANWLRDYLSYSDPKGLGGSYEVTQYIYSSPNVKQLSTDERHILSEIIAVYNLLRNPKYSPIIESPGVPSPRPIDIPKAPRPSSEKEITNFEKKLAEVSSQHGADLAVLKKKLEQTAGPGPTGPVVEEVKKEVEIVKSAPAPKPPVENKAWNNEIKREVATKELPAAKEDLLPAAIKPVEVKTTAQKNADYRAPRAQTPVVVPPAKPVIKSTRPAPKPIPEPTPIPETKYEALMELASLADIHTLDDLKKIEVGHLRQGPIQNQIDFIKQKIDEVIKTQRVMRYYAVLAFEQSPVFKMYLSVGNARVAGGDNQDLGPDEFEAIADLRKQIEQF